MSAGRVLDELLVALRSPDASARRDAALTLRSLRSPKTLNRLRALAYESSEIGPGRAALLALAHMGEPRAIGVCVEVLGRTGPGRAPYVEALGYAEGWRTELVLLSTLGDLEPEVRVQAARSLALRGRPSWQTRVTGDDGDLRRVASSGALELTLPLLRAMSQGSVAAIPLLGVSGDGRAREPLEAALSSEDAEVRAAAAAALEGRGDYRSIGPLEGLLGDAEPAGRAAAAHTLGKLGRSRWVLWVKGDAGDWERLGESGEPKAARPLTQAAKRGEVDAIRALAALGGDEALPRESVEAICLALRALMKRSRHPEVQAAAASTLAVLGQISVAWVLEATGAVQALALLVEDALLSEDAMTALGRLGGAAARDAARAALYGRSRARARALLDEQETLFFAPLRRREIAAALTVSRRPRRRALELLATLEDAEGLLDALVDRDASIRGQACAALVTLGRAELRVLIRGNNGDLRRLTASELPERLRLLVAARDQGADLPAEARALLQEAQAGAFSLGGSAGAGELSLSRVWEGGTLSLEEE